MIDHNYNLKKVAEKVAIKNAYQKINFLFKDSDLLISKAEVKALIDLLNKDHKAVITWLKTKGK